MRSKFTELIQNGVAQFNYINTVTDTRCPLCTLYNNLYSVSTDTRMAPFEDGYIITGDLRGDFYDIKLSNCRDGELKGYFNICHFFSEHNLVGSYSQLNGDKVYILKHGTDNDVCPACPECTPTVYFECNSNIPKPLKELVNNYDKYKILECYSENTSLKDVVDKLNKSPYVKGTWFEYNGVIYGNVNNKNVKL